MKGIIASDIDGTLTDENDEIPPEVAFYLKKLHEEGFVICLVTGRMFSFAKKAVKHFLFPYYLIVQNGAEVLRMPEGEIEVQNFIPRSDLLKIAKVHPGFLAYAGSEAGDFCYYCNHDTLSEQTLEYMEKLKDLVTKGWVKLDHWDQVEALKFSLVKYFGKKEDLKKIEYLLKEEGCFSVSTIQDTIDKSIFILLVTTKNANKGDIVRYLIEKKGLSGPLIAAGDQMNDLSLFQEADCSIAMENGDKELFQYADIIAPPSVKRGVIEGFEKALRFLQR